MPMKRLTTGVHRDDARAGAEERRGVGSGGVSAVAGAGDGADA